MDDEAMDKRARRRRAEAARAELVIDHAAHCRALARFLEEAVPAGRWVVLYDAMPGEVELDGLVRLQPEPGRRFALTRTPESGRRLSVHPWDAPRERHRYGYHQPHRDAPTVADADIGAVVVPGLAFDRWGTRLGWGAGYYDRFLARLDPAVPRIGVTAGLVADDLPFEDHDVAMTHLVGPEAVEPVSPRT